MSDKHGFYILTAEEVLTALRRIAKLSRQAMPYSCDTGLKCLDEIRSIAITLLDKEAYPDDAR